MALGNPGPQPGPHSGSSHLDAELLQAELAAAGCPWRSVEIHDQVSSTNDVALQRLREGAPHGLVIVAEHQDRGRGRMDRTWVDEAGASLLFSVCLRPTVHAPIGWLPLACGLAVAEGVASSTRIHAKVKWPNDVVLDGPGHHGDPGPRKLSGLLMEMADPHAIVLGVGINVVLHRDALPTGQATALNLEGAAKVSREAVLASVLAAIASRTSQLGTSEGAAEVARDYVDRCLTVGQRVRVEVAGPNRVEGDAVGIDPSGCLSVRVNGTVEHMSAGDVIHVRPSPGPRA